MIFRQIIHEDLGCASYLVGDSRTGQVAVIDPQFDIDPYLELASYLGAHIEQVFETHNHADHVSGHGRLVAATGAQLNIPELVEPDYEYTSVKHGDTWELGSVIIQAVHTPGHRPEHTSYIIADTARSEDPWALLSGDSLFVGDVARPDLAVDRFGGAHEIFQSLHERLLTLPDIVEVWPGHLGGSLCGTCSMDLKIASTVGYERAHNPLLNIADEDAFVDQTLSQVGAKPPNFINIVGLNRGPLITTNVNPPVLDAIAFKERAAAGLLLVDVRPVDDFAAGHIEGAVSIQTGRGGFGTKLAWIAEGAEALALIGATEEEAVHAASLAASVGLGKLAEQGGVLAGGFAAWTAAGLPVQTLKQLPAADLVADLKAGKSYQLLDVRERHEFAAGHIEGSINQPWNELTELPDGIDTTEPLYVICAGGPRAGVGASLVQKLGVADVTHVKAGGVNTWREQGGELAVADTSVHELRGPAVV